MPTASILLSAFNEARNLSLYYFNKLKETDVDQCYTVNDVQLNSVKWIMAHLVWAEYMLIMDAILGKKIYKPWMQRVAFGTPMCGADELPPIEEIMNEMKIVHEEVNALLPAVSDEELEEPNFLGMKFGQNSCKRYILLHTIRHEGTHAGHLGWLCKINKLKTS